MDRWGCGKESDGEDKVRGAATTNNLAQKQINKISKQTLSATRQNWRNTTENNSNNNNNEYGERRDDDDKQHEGGEDNNK